MSDSEGIECKSDEAAAQPRYDWTDPNVPAGDSPPHPKWPLIAVAGLWVAWVGFLVVMVIARVHTSPI